MDSAEILLHPVRLRIVQALMGGRELTTKQIAEELADVSAATVYRHVALLHRAGVLRVVGERRARGAIERTYALQVDAARISLDELATMGATEYAAMFRSYIAVLLGHFDRYLAAGDPDLVRDGVGFVTGSLELTDEEFAEYRAEMVRVYQKYADYGPREGSRRRIIATIVLPDRPAGASSGSSPRPAAH